MSMPKGWEEVRLGDIISIGNGKVKPKDDGNIPIYGGNGIMGYTNICNYQDETIILGRVGAYCGSVYYENSQIWVTDNALSVKAKNNYNMKYLYYVLKFLNLNSYATGSGHPLITQSLINNIKAKITLNIKEQEKIAEILSSCDEHIKNLKNLKSELEKEKLHLMNELLSGKTRFANFTTPWQEVAIKDIFQEYTKLNSDNYDQYTIGKNGIKPFEDKRHSITNHKTFKKNDLIIGIGIDEVNININIENGCCSPIYHIYNLNEEKLNPIFGYFAIKTLIQPIKGKIIKTSTRRQFEFTHSEFLKYFLILPSLEEQKKIGEVLSACDERLECLNELITAETTLKSHLLTELLSGNIRVQND